MPIAKFLRGLSPFGPVFGKELRISARLKRTYFLRSAFLGVLLLALLFAWLETRSRSQYVGAAQRNAQLAELGQIFFGIFSVFLVMTMGILGPVFCATAISSERLHKTLPVLLMTPITAWQIVAGKLFSRLLIALTLIGLGLPVLALIRLLGGVELEQMFGVIALAIVAAVSSAAVGLFFSTLLNRAYAVILLAFLTMLFLHVFVPFVIAMSFKNVMGNRSFVQAIQLILSISPYWLVWPAAIPDIYGTRLGIGLPWGWCIGSNLALTLILVMASAAILRRQSRSAGASPATTAAPPIPEPAPLPIDTAGPAPLVLQPIPQIKKPRPSRPARSVADNAVLWRELRRPLMARRWQRIVAVVLCALLLIGTYALIGNEPRGLTDPENQAAWGCVFNFLFSGLAIVLSATAIAQEKESDTWTLLLATPVSGAAVVWGKALGALRRMLWPAVFIAGHFLVFTVTGVIPLHMALAAVWIIITFNTIWIATGVYFSLRFRKVTTAVVANLLLAIAAYLLVWMTLVLIENSLRSNDYQGGFFDHEASAHTVTKAAMTGLFLLGTAWWICTLLMALRRKRGAMGQLMLVTLVYFTILAGWAGWLKWIPMNRMYAQVGWYTPYYYMAQLPWGADRSSMYLPAGWGTVNGATFSGAIILFGFLHMAMAAFVLAVTGRKFSALVGRADQVRKPRRRTLSDAVHPPSSAAAMG